MQRKITTIIIAMLLCLAFVSPVQAAPSVTLDGKQLSFEVPPVTENDRTLVPLRAIFEAMGATVTWDEGTQTATANKGNTTVVIQIGSVTPTINGQVKQLDVPAKVVNGRTLAPLRFVGEAFGGTVSWDEITQTVTMTSLTTNVIKPGQYKVGSDIDPGEYLLIANDGHGYFSINKDSTGTIDSIVANDNFHVRSIVTVSSGQYLELKYCSAYLYSKGPAIQVKDNVIGEGMYKVGIDIQPGEYKIESTEVDSSGYVAVSSDSSHKIDSIITNDNFTGSKYITVKANQYLRLVRAKIYLK